MVPSAMESGTISRTMADPVVVAERVGFCRYDEYKGRRLHKFRRTHLPFLIYLKERKRVKVPVQQVQAGRGDSTVGNSSSVDERGRDDAR